MKKMPCLFVRNFHGRSFDITEQVTPGCEWVIAGEGVASIKRDGTACMVRNGQLFKRYDAKHGKTPPTGFEPCGEPDPVTGHHPGWVPVPTETDGPADVVWHQLAWQRWDGVDGFGLADGTYELCGPMVQGNPENLAVHTFIKHGAETSLGYQPPPKTMFVVLRSFEALREFLRTFPHEGLVFAHPDGRMCKIRRDDFGFEWPLKKKAA